jgi:hypothetical protein
MTEGVPEGRGSLYKFRNSKITMIEKYWQLIRNNWKENLYLISLAAVLIALPTSIALLSGLAFALPIIWIITGDYKTKWNRLINNRNALLLCSIPFIYLIGLCFTNNFSVGFQELNKSSYWFIFAFYLSSSPPISYKNTCRLLGIYVLVVSIAAAVALIKLFFIDTFLFSDFRAVTWVDHIPFSYQIAFTIWLIFYFIIHEKFPWVQKLVLLLLIAFLFITLFSLKSFNAYIYFGVMSITALFMLIWKAKKKLLKITISGLTILLIVFPVFYVYHCVQKFYNITEYNADEIEHYTSNGNKYEHDFNDKSKENGHYISLFICEEELMPLWNAHSKKQYNSITSAGYPLNSVVIRYMTSKGLKKDAEGFMQLSPKDIANIENEFTNYIYAENKLAVYPRVYETIWEMDIYRNSQNPNGKSLPERVEQVILAFDIFKKHAWFGIGLGNNAEAYDEAIVETGSKLAHQDMGWVHNQYLNYLIRFGILGALYILGVLICVFIKGRKNNPFLITIFFVSMLAANFGEANWETFVGINFFAFFFCFLMWANTKRN